MRREDDLARDMNQVAAAELLEGLPVRIHEVYESFARATPDHPAFVEGDLVWSYRAFSQAVQAAAEDLRGLGIRRGDRLIVVSENCVALAALLFAASRLDAWAIAANPRLSPRELDQINHHSGARRMLFTNSISKEAGGHAARLGAAAAKIGPFAEIGVGGLNEAAQPEPVSAHGAEQVAALMYTSGTTGAPKGVMLSHYSLLFSAKIAGLLRDLRPEDRVYGVLPISHIVGFSIVLVATLMFGATARLVPRYDPELLAHALADDEVSILYGVPATFQRLLAYKTLNGIVNLQGGALRLVSVAGAPLALDLKSRIEQEFGRPLLNAYITECSPGISTVLSHERRADDSVGTILPGVEARICKFDGSIAAEGEVGELHVRGPNVMLGYYRAPDLTASDAEGWYKSGDLARFDGPNLFGRVKEMIIRSGFNVYPAEVEAVLNAHKAVVQSAVIGRNVEGNEEVVAFVQLLPGSAVGSAELLAYAREQLTAYKRPCEIIILEALPASSTGKILKHKLREMLHET